VAAELACDWHTVNDAVTTYGQALLEADRKRLNQTKAIGLDETSFVRAGEKRHTHYVTTVADVENHQIINILPTRKYTDVAGWIDLEYSFCRTSHLTACLRCNDNAESGVPSWIRVSQWRVTPSGWRSPHWIPD
jgi:hypothetical protein